MELISPTGFWRGRQTLAHQRAESLERWLVSYLEPYKEGPIYDFGCGLGHYLSALESAGFENLTGFEGEVPASRFFERVLPQDLTKPFKVEKPGVVLLLEVGEHVPPQYETQLLRNVSDACSGLLVLSWALRGQGGDGHFNEMSNEEVVEKLKVFGFALQEDDTQQVRGLDFRNAWWFRNTLMIFKRKI